MKVQKVQLNLHLSTFKDGIHMKIMVKFFHPLIDNPMRFSI